MRKFTFGILTYAAIALTPVLACAQPAQIKNIVLVHGAYADGSGWRGVADILSKDGYNVSVVQIPETSLEDDVAATRRILAQQNGPAILVGHSYGGVVITEAGEDAKVAGLVYVAAIAPDVDEKLSESRAKFPPATNNTIDIGDGFLILDPKTFHHDFAADLPEADANFMAHSQVAVAGKALGTPVKFAAWKHKPSWYVVSTEDQKINPEFERFMAKRAGSKVTEVKGSHVAFIAQPKAIAAVIEDAANTAQK